MFLPYSGGVQYNGGSSVPRGVFSTLEGYHQHTGGCSVHWRNHQYNGRPRCTDDNGDIPSVLMISLRYTERPLLYCTDVIWGDLFVKCLPTDVRLFMALSFLAHGSPAG